MELTGGAAWIVAFECAGAIRRCRWRFASRVLAARCRSSMPAEQHPQIPLYR